MIGYIKGVLTVLAAALGGFTIGSFTTGRMAGPWLLAGKPAWAGKAEFMALVAVVGAAVCVAAWVYVDYKYSVNA